eukprot:scaffold7402_cov78-Cylindrotheca_fusiformis.AAC.2
MHNGMNTGKALADFLFRWAANNREASQTINKAKPLFTAVQLLRLENFKALPFDKSTFGGYVGENWSCFHQISPWAFSFLDDPDMQTTIFHPPPEKAVTDYSVNELKAWLLCRGLHFPTVARKTELLSLVLHFQMDGDHHHAADSVTTGSGLQGTQMRQIFLASSRYFSSLMADTTSATMSVAMEQEHRSESYAMLLLAEITSFLDIQPEVADAGKEVRKKSSLLGLLCTPSHFEHVPQVRSLHEGGVLGEGMVKRLREYLQHGLKENWAVPMHQRVMRDESLSFLRAALMPLEDLPRQSESYHGTKFRRYQSLADAQEILDLGHCLSLLVYRSMTTSSIYLGIILLGGPKKWTFQQVTYRPLDPSCYHDPTGLSYFPISFSEI